MIDPLNITNFDRTDADLEEFWIFCICVAGKNALTTAKAVANLIDYPDTEGPFDSIRAMVADGVLIDRLKDCGIGQFQRLSRCLVESVGGSLDLRTCTTSDLEEIHGVGPKTSRFFILHSRENARYAALDTHILKYLKEQGYSTPLATPPKGPVYRKLEDIFLAEADESGMSVADFDLFLWKKYSGRST